MTQSIKIAWQSKGKLKVQKSETRTFGSKERLVGRMGRKLWMHIRWSFSSYEKYFQVEIFQRL